MCDIIKKISFFLLFILVSLTVPATFINAQENPEVKAIQLFNSGKFAEAESLLQQLLEKNEESPILNYYYAASRTENGHFGKKELEYLKKAGKNITPDRLHYYLAMQYHALEDWDQALKFYNQYRVSVPESEQKELELQKKIQLCYNQINLSATVSEEQDIKTDTAVTEELVITEKEEPINPPITAEATDTLSTFVDIGNLDADLDLAELNPGKKLFFPREVLPDLPGVKPTIPDGDPVQFQVNSSITYLYTSQFRTEEGKSLFEKAKTLQQQQDRNLQETKKLRKEYTNIQSPEQRDLVASKIISLENESYFLEEEIKTTYSKSRMVENDYWENAGPVSRNNFLMEQEKLQSSLKEVNSLSREPEEEILIDFVKPAPKTSARPVAPELVYKIQVGAYSKGVPAYMQKLYRKLSVIRTIDSYTDEKGIVVYTTGNLSKYEDALKMQHQVKQEGIQDASVVPYFKGKRITLEQAKQLEANNDI